MTVPRHWDRDSLNALRMRVELRIMNLHGRDVPVGLERLAWWISSRRMVYAEQWGWERTPDECINEALNSSRIVTLAADYFVTLVT